MRNDLCQPFKDLEEVKNWKPILGKKHFTHCLEERISVPNAPKTLICHDMKGGYLEDSYLNGVKDDSCYFFVHWSVVDVFVYFSHHFVTIPPCAWISSAHKNGTKILGTFITEWDSGSQLCESFLSDKKSVHELAQTLVCMAVYYNFDGWLINIENKLQCCQVPLLEEFVKSLTKRMHKEKASSLVIWYDSVIESGELKWQNALNESNRNFFDCCDGIFLNYNWKDEDLEKSVVMSSTRKTDVYVGVDVFGRGCLGGGGFCTNVAVRAARDFGLSVAIFAPGWVYECLDIKNFKENQYKFWDSLAEYFSLSSIKCSSFSSSFCPGFGKKRFRRGKILSNEPWHNMALQETQPTYHYDQSSLCIDEAYDGGGCLQFSGESSHGDGRSDFDFLAVHIQLRRSYLLRYTIKLPLEKYSQRSLDASDFMLLLTMNSVQGPYVLHLVASNFQPKSAAEGKDVFTHKYPVEQEVLKKFGLESIENHWFTRCYILESDVHCDDVIEKVTARITSSVDKKQVMLGKLQILPIDEDNVLKVSNFSIVKPIETKLFINCSLEWKQHSGVTCWDIFYKVGEREVFINTTCQSFYTLDNFQVDNLDVTVDRSFDMEFILYPLSEGIQACDPLCGQVHCVLSSDYFE